MKYKYKSMFLAIILALSIAACNMPLSGQDSESFTNFDENVQVVPTAAQAEQGAPVENLQPVSGDARGYILFAPLRSSTTYLIDFDGNVVHTWPSEYFPGNAVYLLEDGNLLRTGTSRNQVFNAGGAGGILQKIDWEGNVLWEFEYSSDRYLLHHDIEQLPNGNILMVAWEYKSEEDAVAAGRDPDLLQDGALWADKVIEVDPASGQIVWEWHVWDHLVQDHDPAKANYGDPSAYPKLVDINYTTLDVADWNHINAVDYDPGLDQILLSVHTFSEIWIIDHGTTSSEAAGPSGDLLYRWGNPQAYEPGSVADQQLFAQHDAHWIDAGLPGGGDILVFNNGDRHSRPYSSVEEITLPLNADGSYGLTGATYGPAAPTWTYTAEPATDFYAVNISGAQRLPDGNTLICDGPSGVFFEVTPSGETVWRYVNPYGQSAPGRVGGTTESQGSVFRAMYYAEEYTGLAGRDLSVSMNLAPEDPVVNRSQKGEGLGLSGQHQIPQAAIDACSGLGQGAACTIRTPKDTLTGICQTPPQSTSPQLACAPARNR
jgi:hypothetical protein